MSDFFQNEGQDVGRYPEATVIMHLKACQAITSRHSRDLFASFHTQLEEKLLDFVDNAKSNEEARQLQETVRLLRHSSNDLTQHFVNQLSEGFIKFKRGRLDTQGGEEKFRSDMLSLVDHEDLEETIALSSIVHRMEELFGEGLWFLNQRLAALNDGEKVRDSNNPMSPVQFCEALRKSLATLAWGTKAKIIAYKVFDAELSEALGGILQEANRYLAEQDILPNLHYLSGARPAAARADSKPASAAPEAKSPRPDASAATPAPAAPVRLPGEPGSTPSDHQGGLIQAIRTLQNHLDPATSGRSAGTAAYNAPVQGSAAAPNGIIQQPVYSNQQLVSALQTLQQQAVAISVGATNMPAGEGSLEPQDFRVASQQLMTQLQAESENGRVDPNDMHTIDLVGMLFEYMLSDEQLPDSVKTLLSYLHTPFLKMAFIDSTFFEKAEHPARLLLNSLAEAGTRWVSNDGTSQYDIYPKIKQTVSRVLEDFENDVRLFAELLLEFSAYVKKIARRQDLMEKRAMEKVQGEEKLREVKLRVNREVRSRTDGKELPSAVLLLLLQPWSDYLAFLLLRYGEKSDSWRKALTAVDEILWSIETKEDSKDKARQLEMLDQLLELIESGFETIGYDQARGKKLIEALVSLQKMAMASRKPAPAPAPMRDKLESEAAEKAGGEPAAEKPTSEEAKMVENLKMIEFGTWFEFEGGKRLKVAWYNSKTMHYMLVDQMGKKVAMRSGLELARGMLSGKARVIAGSTKPFFERALENIFQNLNAKADALHPEVSDA